MQGVKLPELPSNARYLYHPNQCYDWGTFGWVFDTQGVDPTAYKHYIFLNSSVRGPFLPPYLQVSTPAAAAGRCHDQPHHDRCQFLFVLV